MKHMNIPFSPPDISEEEVQAVSEVLRSGWITTGPKTKQFERELADYCGTKRFVCLNSSTAAMELTLRVLGIGEGDEVIVGAYTYTASCSVIKHVGATPVMVDCQKDNFTLDLQQLEKAINEKTKMIISIDVGGVLCDYDAIYKIIEKKKECFHGNNDLQNHFGRIILMGDCAHGLGAKRNGLACGQHADFTTYSFHAVKNLTTAEGGGVTWKDETINENDTLYRQFQLYSLHGQTKDALSKTKAGSWEYDIVIPGYKCNMTDIQASIGLVQLHRYESMLDRRHEIIQAYTKCLEKFNVKTLIHTSDHHRSSGHLFMIFIQNCDEEKRNKIIEAMAKRGVSCNVHYKPLPMFTAYKNMGFNISDYPNAYALYTSEITIPLYSTLSDQQVAYIIDHLQAVLGEFQCY